MMNERFEATLDDLREVESREELKRYEELLMAEEFGADQVIVALIDERRKQLPEDTVKILASYLIELEELKKEEPAPEPKQKVSRSVKWYRLLKKEVDWSTTPQVHAVMLILCSVVEVGEVVGEDRIIEAMEANREVLNTRQAGEKIWKYYKSNSIGLLAHGNIEEA